MSGTETIPFDDFMKVDIRAGTITDVDDLKGARNPAYKLIIDFGDDIGTRQSSAQITDLYAKDQLIGKQVIAVINFAPKRIAGFKSEVLVTGFPDEHGRVVLATPNHPVPNGARLF